jgi:glycosyltransferase involved in cell wall biosynthesis
VENKPLVSVVTIFFNAERFLPEAIESVLSQTYENWELLLVDDGSTDMSTAMAKGYVTQYSSKVRYLEHKAHRNQGMSASRNLGIREAKGEYVAFLDADDVYLPQKLERQVVLLQSQPTAAMVYGATPHWHSWTGKPEDQHRDVMRKLAVPLNSLIQPPALLPLFLRHQAQTPATCSVLVRRQAIECIGAFEERFRGMFEDQVFFYKIFLHAPVFVEGGSWDRYRIHPNSHTKMMAGTGEYDLKGGPNPAYRKLLLWLKEYLQSQQIVDQDLWNALNAEMRPYRHPIVFNFIVLWRWVKLTCWSVVRKKLARKSSNN